MEETISGGGLAEVQPSQHVEVSIAVLGKESDEKDSRCQRGRAVAILGTLPY
jgi:hypothetical protein